MKYAIAELDFDEGLAFYGPFNLKEHAHEYVAQTDMNAHVHCEVVEVHEKAFDASWLERHPEDEPHVLVTGRFTGGYTLYGPFPSLEAAESVGGDFPEHVHLMPLIRPAY